MRVGFMNNEVGRVVANKSGRKRWTRITVYGECNLLCHHARRHENSVFLGKIRGDLGLERP